ncbi:L-threonylcarbamoyladenylate synthase [Oceanobacillus caeni]|uniref:L-threonylcarbamoyladenylate synthase n=1 Tax=Oceanobacillus TaxID=182709 RepID=UPI00195898B7|nr:L-threonylcarbamoyladenylate synthase [Oceanobacillus caeni]MBU8789911.1 threonylcarbamoyl-AMP synthase [Oceanobacillus caeni]MCR1835782.1 L-threonylcarbamoyladenylate synthase [Oceanobacillus caeni]
METKRWNVTINESMDKDAIEEAAALLRSGETVAFPTETVYGLGADATNENAVAKIFTAKGRPQDNPLIAHVATKEQLKRLVDNIPPYAEKLMDLFSPGPITYILPTNGTCAENVTAGLSTVGVRIPDHPVARELLKTCDIPIAAPSANVSGKPSPTLADHVWEDLQGKISGLLDGGATGVGVESTVLDCTQVIPIILRPGGVTKEQLEEVVGTVIVDPSLANKNEKPKAPGMKYRHYSPEVPMWLVKGSVEKIQQLINDEREKGKKIGVLASSQTSAKLEVEDSYPLGDNIHEIATHLYDGLRKYKQGDVDLIICEAFSDSGVGQAVMNRLQKAATEYIVEGI